MDYIYCKFISQKATKCEVIFSLNEVYKMTNTTLALGTRSISVLATELCSNYPIVYTHLSAEAAEAVASLLNDTKFVLVAIDRVDWNAELSPWPARRAFRGELDFAGGADAYLSELIHQIIPTVEALTGYIPDYRAIAGYSMAGLFSIYAQYHTDLFSRSDKSRKPFC